MKICMCQDFMVHSSTTSGDAATGVSEFQACRGRHALRQSSDGTVRGKSC